ncbi:homeobox protein DBX2-like isoform X1 [Huso huso]|uniref:Homeobox protein DBX2-like isoform X1 n=1 Tax=Huso huso TaxID=61971 RepID=A0ABR0ZCB3_HUSHU
MVPSSLPAQNLYWEMAGSYPFLHAPKPPGFGNSGKSFLIDNLLKDGDSQDSSAPWVPVSPVPVKLCPTAEQISPSGGPYSTRWGFQLVNPSDRQRAQSPNRELLLQPQPVFLKNVFPRAPQFLVACCGGSCPLPAPPTAFSKGSNSFARWSQEVNTKSRRGILKRAVFSEEQRKDLEKTFHKQKYISKTDRNNLAEHLGLKESQVKIWFQNRRMKWRNSKEKETFCHKSCEEEEEEDNLLESELLSEYTICAAAAAEAEDSQITVHCTKGNSFAFQQGLQQGCSSENRTIRERVLFIPAQHQDMNILPSD